MQVRGRFTGAPLIFSAFGIFVGQLVNYFVRTRVNGCVLCGWCLQLHSPGGGTAVWCPPARIASVAELLLGHDVVVCSAAVVEPIP